MDKKKEELFMMENPTTYGVKSYVNKEDDYRTMESLYWYLVSNNKSVLVVYHVAQTPDDIEEYAKGSKFTGVGLDSQKREEVLKPDEGFWSFKARVKKLISKGFLIDENQFVKVFLWQDFWKKVDGDYFCETEEKTYIRDLTPDQLVNKELSTSKYIEIEIDPACNLKEVKRAFLMLYLSRSFNKLESVYIQNNVDVGEFASNAAIGWRQENTLKQCGWSWFVQVYRRAAAKRSPKIRLVHTQKCYIPKTLPGSYISNIISDFYRKPFIPLNRPPFVKKQFSL